MFFQFCGQMILLEENEWVDEIQNISLLYLSQCSWKNYKTEFLKETDEPVQFSARTFLKILRDICPEDPGSSAFMRKPEIVLIFSQKRRLRVSI